ncbi:hypothetical protein NM208_g10832 [Fusarium decemcellulare]|uniref:Uncharacterized protein n=1 Tax=Fusarium decemcellulare TaxID=57161 RepID=A0ACC1RWH2_9HYPO|nr:hypothetical protein NM208_g10832 [Fusarium decemcellulare]
MVNHKPPPSTQACQESRSIAQADGQFYFGSNGGVRKSLWFSPSRDIIYFESWAQWLDIYRHNLDEVKNVAVKWPGEDMDDMVELLTTVEGLFPDCKRLLFVMDYELLPDDDIEFFPIRRNEDVRLNFDNDLLDTWSSQLLHVRAEIGSPMPNKTATDAHPKEASSSPTFPQFRKFPPEVRAIIWEYSFGGPRIFRMKPYSSSNPPNYIPMVVSHKPPASSQACQEARDILQKCGTFLFGQHGSPIKSLWFNPSQYILYWDLSYPIEAWADHILDGIDGVKTVAVAWCGPDEDDQSYVVQLVENLFQKCEKLVMVVTHRPLPNKDVQFLPIEDHDNFTWIWAGLGDPVTSWDSVKGHFEGAMEFLVETEFILPFQFPPLEAVEAIPKCCLE